jgi:hypothetical protein
LAGQHRIGLETSFFPALQRADEAVYAGSVGRNNVNLFMSAPAKILDFNGCGQGMLPKNSKFSASDFQCHWFTKKQ